MLADLNVKDDNEGGIAPAYCDSRAPCIYLSSAQCEALGLTTPPAAGTTVKLSGVAVFQIVTQAEGGARADVSATLRVTHLELGAMMRPSAKSLYGDGDE